ncbi:hypothetical protein DENSPDRAFT_886205 [Dentipellis sp. KUC8613]|nr:hypothetical protein DENSPDRAFT_886205 [Dentipellis sp. KUC8613]
MAPSGAPRCRLRGPWRRFRALCAVFRAPPPSVCPVAPTPLFGPYGPSRAPMALSSSPMGAVLCALRLSVRPMLPLRAIALTLPPWRALTHANGGISCPRSAPATSPSPSRAPTGYSPELHRITLSRALLHVTMHICAVSHRLRLPNVPPSRSILLLHVCAMSSRSACRRCRAACAYLAFFDLARAAFAVPPYLAHCVVSVHTAHAAFDCSPPSSPSRAGAPLYTPIPPHSGLLTPAPASRSSFGAVSRPRVAAMRPSCAIRGPHDDASCPHRPTPRSHRFTRGPAVLHAALPHALHRLRTPSTPCARRLLSPHTLRRLRTSPHAVRCLRTLFTAGKTHLAQ